MTSLDEGKSEQINSAQLSDPLLLTVKMLLSEVRSWSKKYEFPHYVCTHFAKIVFDSMTVRGVRCGYTIVEFSNGQSHAIVAFNTDYGLVYVEPQSGDVEYSLEEGKKCPYGLAGIPDDATITRVSIRWNGDANKIDFIECQECGYLLPLYNDQLAEQCPICDSHYSIKPRNDIITRNTSENTRLRRIQMADESKGYTAEISRKNPGCILFLIDQSESMEDDFGGEVKRKADGAADALNTILHNLVTRCTKGEETRHYFDVGVIGYGETVGPAFVGELAGRALISVSELLDHCRIEEHVQDGEEKSKIPIWFDAVAKNRTPMCQAIRDAHRILSDWITEHESSYPPIVINITDGEANDGNPVEPARELLQLCTNAGNVLLFNCHLSSHPTPPILYPSTDKDLIDEFAKMLFSMSSVLPINMIKQARDEELALEDGARGFVFNAKSEDLTRFLIMGTRPSMTLR